MPALVITGLFVVSKTIIGQQKHDGLIINLAGRQRMLTQKMSKELVLFSQSAASGEPTEAIAAQVIETAKVFDMTLIALRDGGKAPLSFRLNDQTKYSDCPAATGRIHEQLTAVTTRWQQFYGHVNTVIRGKDESGQVLDKVMSSNLALLKDMNTAVVMMQTSAEKKLGFLLTVQVIGIIIAGMCVAWSLFLVLNITKSLNEVIARLTEGSNQVANASEQISTASASLADGACSQSGELDTIADGLSKTSTQATGNAGRAEQTNALAEQARQSAQEGTESMAKMNSAIEDIQQSAQDTASIVKVIDGIAFQTNMLALNAAVEAAQAGDAGRGFAVVAEEVRSLAMRSADAARNTTKMIEAATRNANNGVDIAAEVEKTLVGITEGIGKTCALTNDIASASKQQAQSIENINKAVEQMGIVVQANAATAEQSASASEELSNQAAELDYIVGHMVALAHGEDATASDTEAQGIGCNPSSSRPSLSLRRWFDRMPLLGSKSHHAA